MIISNLQTPIQFFNVEITKIGWALTYPSNSAYYQLYTNDGIKVIDGHYIVDSLIVQSWGVDDSVITDAIVNASPWNINI